MSFPVFVRLASPLLVLAASVAVAQAPAAELIVQATAFESTDGQATILLLDSPTAWDQMFASKQSSKARSEWTHQVAVADVPIQEGVAAVRFTPLPPGEYAVIVFHDKNGNQMLDRNFMGIPKEEVGVSNDYRMSGFPPSPPKWDDVKFSVQAGGNQKELEMGMLRSMGLSR